MPGDEEAQPSSRRPPPDPLDRVWLHPSELFRRSGAPTGPRRGRRGTVVAVAGVLTAAGVTAGLVAVGAVGGGGEGVPASIVPPRAAAAEMVAAVGASVVAVRVTDAGGTVAASGVCVAPGRVLTSAHAVEEGATVTVSTRTGGPLSATVAGRDPETGLALLRVDTLTMRPARLGSADGLRPGAPLVAVAAGARRHWVSVGEVVALDGMLQSEEGVVAGLVDTDTAAGAEHAGGAVLDANGDVVAVLAVTPASSPSGLAVPVDVVRDVVAQLETTGRALHGWLGVAGSDDDERAGGGARIEQLTADGPAEAAGLEPGDVVVALGDDRSSLTSVSSMSKLVAEVRMHRPGDVVELTVLRGDGERHVSVRLGHGTSEGDTVVEPVGEAGA